MRSWRVRLLLAFILLSLAACDQNEQAGTIENSAQSPSPAVEAQQQKTSEKPPTDSKETTPAAQEPIPKIIPDIQAEAIPFLQAYYNHLKLQQRGQDEFLKLFLKAMKIDEDAAWAAREKYSSPRRFDPVFPELEDYVSMLQRDKKLQALTAAANNPAKNKERRTRDQLTEIRKQYLETRLQEYVKSLGAVDNRYKKGSGELFKIIDSQ